jgi:nucleotide-binding universal stress UspA family protein
MSPTAMKKQPSRTTPTKPKVKVTRILVPFDFGDPAIHALAYAKELALQFGASIELLHVVSVPYIMPVTDAGFLQLPDDYVESLVQEAKDRLAAALAAGSAPGQSRATVKTGDARAEILDFAEAKKIDLIVMCTRGRTGASHLIFGSVAEHVVRTAPCPVLIVR